MNFWNFFYDFKAYVKRKKKIVVKITWLVYFLASQYFYLGPDGTMLLATRYQPVPAKKEICQNTDVVCSYSFYFIAPFSILLFYDTTFLYLFISIPLLLFIYSINSILELI